MTPVSERQDNVRPSGLAERAGSVRPGRAGLTSLGLSLEHRAQAAPLGDLLSKFTQ